jgi:alpha-L-fucosidase
LIINNRVDKGRQGMKGINRDDKRYAGDFGTPEKQIPTSGLPGVDWETCMTMNDTWGFKHYDDNWKTPHSLHQPPVMVRWLRPLMFLRLGPSLQVSAVRSFALSRSLLKSRLQADSVNHVQAGLQLFLSKSVP